MAATFKTNPLTVSNGSTQSSSYVNLTKGLLGSITCPANIGSATTLTFQHSKASDGTFTTITDPADGSSDYTVTLTASKTIPINTNLFVGVGYLKVSVNLDPGTDITFDLNWKDAE